MYFGDLCRRLLYFHTHMHTHTHTLIHTHFLSRIPRVHSTWQLTGATYLFSNISVQCLETECLTGMEMMKHVWTLLAGWDGSQLYSISHRTTHSWKRKWVWSSGWHNERWLLLLKSVGHKRVNVCSWEFYKPVLPCKCFLTCTKCQHMECLLKYQWHMEYIF